MHKIATTGKFDDIKGTVAAYLDTLDVEKWFNSYGEKFDIDIENFNIDTIETTFIDTYQVLIKFNCRDITTNEIKVFQNREKVNDFLERFNILTIIFEKP